MFFLVMSEIGLVCMIIGGICSAIGKFPVLKATRQRRKLVAKQKKMQKKKKKS